ncbi:MAG TPA: GtrA family protein [Anaerolineales bacterium]|nr:GtrA family protein [Anaerolineales bacterium]
MRIKAVQLYQTKKIEFKRFAKFIIIGLMGTAIDFGVFTLLKKGFGISTPISNSISFSLAVLNAFLWNRYWTYPDSRSKPMLQQLTSFVIINLIGWGTNTGITTLLEAPFGVWVGMVSPTLSEYGAWFAKALATGVVLFWNFLANRYITFGDVGKKNQPN